MGPRRLSAICPGGNISTVERALKSRAEQTRPGFGGKFETTRCDRASHKLQWLGKMQANSNPRYLKKFTAATEAFPDPRTPVSEGGAPLNCGEMYRHGDKKLSSGKED